MDLNLILQEITDTRIRENFHRIQLYLQSQTVLTPEFKFYQVSIKEASDKFPVTHGLPFVPIDIIVLSASGNHNFYFRYQDFDRKSLYVHSTGPVTIRFLAGRFPNQTVRQTSVDSYPLVGPETTSGGGETQTGSNWYTGNGAPSPSMGADGDFYINTSNHHVYSKANGTWSDLGLIGATGPQGPPGTPGNPANLYAEVIELNATQISQKKLQLTYPVGNVLGTLVDVIGGTSARINFDFQVIGNQTLSWDGLGLSTTLEVGDVLRISYTV